MRIVDSLSQWYLKKYFAKYPAKRREQLASLGRNLGEDPRLLRLGRIIYEGARGPELRFRSADDGGRIHLSVAILEAGIVRVAAIFDGRPRLDKTWAVCGRPGETPLAGRSREDWSAFSCPPFELVQRSRSVIARTAELDVEISFDPFGITWKTAAGKLLAKDAPEGALSYEPSWPDGRMGRALRHSMIKTASRFYGFGEKAGPLNKDGLRLVMMNLDSMGYDAKAQDPLYKHFPCYIALDPSGTKAFGFFYDNFSVSEFDIGASDPSRVVWTADAGEADWYFVNGPTMPEVVRRFALLSGKPCLPPRWSLGYGGSTMGYTEAPDAQARLERFLALCEEKDFPCDIFHLSSGYTTGEDGKRYVFEWNKGRVPDPEELFRHYREAQVHVSANVKPALLTSHPRYAEVDAMGGFVKGPDGNSFVAPFWGGLGSWIDFSNPKARDWWKARMKESLLVKGVDSSWNDNNEFEAWNENCRCDGFGEHPSVDQMRPLLTYHMVRSSLEAQREQNPDKRPFVLTRSACAGMQRYAQTWSGDNYATWKDMRWNTPMGLGLSLSAMPNFGHDAGGFSGFKIGPELFVRWIQVASLHPRFCIHSWHFDKSVNEPWMHPSVTPAVREAFTLRYRLLPYLYSLFAQASRSGDPILRPLVYHFPTDAAAAEESFDFMLGPWLLAAPVYRPRARKRQVYLPEGSEWLDFYTGQRYSELQTGQMLRLDAPLDRIPLLARAGSILPMGPALKRANAHPDELREIRLYPAAGEKETEFILYEDDGDSLQYLEGENLEISLKLKSGFDSLSLEVSKEGRYRPDYVALDFLLPPTEKRSLFFQGGELSSEQRPDGWRCFRLGLEKI